MKRVLGVLLALGLALPASAATPRQQTINILKNGATAQESWRTQHDSYTERVRRLREEGFTYDKDKIRFFVSWATANGYCLHARHEAMRRPMHFESRDGTPEMGPCPATRQARKRWRDQMNELLKDAAIAQENYATSHNGAYTSDMADLRAEGFRNPYEEIRVVVVSAQDDRYCMQAMHRGLDVGQYYDSNEGVPRTGGCPG